MNPNTQIEDMVDAWSQLQQQLWESWLGATPVYPTNWWTELYTKSLEINKDMVNLGLQGQSDALRICMKSLKSVDGTPEFMSQWSKQMETITQRWTNGQRQACEAWFMAAKDWDPMHSSEKWSAPVKNMFQTWQFFSHKTLEMQADLISAVAPSSETTATTTTIVPTKSKKKSVSRKVTETRNAA